MNYNNVAYASAVDGKVATTPLKVSGPNVGLIQALSGEAPGGWSSNHRKEAQHNTGWHYIAIRQLALQFAESDVSVYNDKKNQKKKDKRRQFIKNHGLQRWKSYASNNEPEQALPETHPLVKILKNPNPTQGGKMFRYELAQQLGLTGNVLIWNVPNGVGKTVQRYIIPTAIATPMMGDSTFPNGFWRIRPEMSHWGPESAWIMTTGMIPMIGADIPAEQVQRISWPHALFRNDGQSPTAAGSLWSDTADMIDTRRHSHMKRGVRNSGIVTLTEEEFSGTQEELNRISQKANEKWAGPNNDGQLMFVTGGKVVKMDASAKDMDYPEGFKQMRDANLAIHGVPGVVAGITDGASYAAFYASLLQCTRLTIQPQLGIIAEEETQRFAPQFGEGLTVEMLAADVDDPSMLEKELNTDGAAGIRTVDEWRGVRGLPPAEDKEFGKTYVKFSAPPTVEQGGMDPNEQINGPSSNHNDGAGTGNASNRRTGAAGSPTPEGSKDTSKGRFRFARNGHANDWESY